MSTPEPFPYASAGFAQIIPFGAYPQSAGGAAAPILWRVLRSSSSRLLLLSEYLLDCKRYHNENLDTTWRDCDLRCWLNDAFYQAAFTPAERQRIALTLCSANGAGSPDTEDHVFLLSVDEIKTYTDQQDGTPTTIRRRAIGTDFAKARKPDGCHLYVYDKDVEKDYILEHGQKLGCSWWWTRSQPQMQNGTCSRAAFIGARSNIKTYGRVDLPYYGVRPALNIDISV